VIGGLLIATVATLVFVPSVFSLVHKRIEKTPEENLPEQELSART
jgi:Cu/Ag efflux pump CusA